MSLSDAPCVARGDLDADLGNVLWRPTQNGTNAVKSLGGKQGEYSLVQIHNEALAQRKNKITTVSAHGGDAARMSVDFCDAADRMGNRTRRCNFRKDSRGDLRNYMNGRIKLFWAGRESRNSKAIKK